MISAARPRLRSLLTMFAVALCSVAIQPTTASSSELPDDEQRASGLQTTPVANSANGLWLVDIYEETLGRPADEPGLDFWLSRLAGGGSGSRLKAVNSFVYSTEGSGVEVQRAYQDLLERAPEPGGASFWTHYLRTHPVTILRSNLIASDEYFELHGGTVTTWLEALYLEVLERPIDNSGATYWADRVATGIARWQIVLAIYLSAESLSNRADSYGLEILDRALTDQERAEGAALIATQDERAFRALLLASDEAFEPYLEAVGLRRPVNDRSAEES